MRNDTAERKNLLGYTKKISYNLCSARFVFYTRKYAMKKNLPIKTPCSEAAGTKSLLFMFAAALLFLSPLFMSCTSSVELRANGDGSVNITYDAAFGSAFIEIMQALSGGGTSPLFDADEMTAQFRAAGVNDVRITSPADTSLGIRLCLPKNGIAPVSQSGCISRSANSLSLVLSPESCAKLYKLLPDTMQSYIDLCMAPLFLGEPMEQNEYVDLIASVYGQALADELKRSKIKISLFAPNDEKKASKTVELPLAELLTSKKPVSFSVAW